MGEIVTAFLLSEFFQKVYIDRFARYFGAFPDDVIKSFYETFDDWELHMVIEALSQAGIGLGRSDLVNHQTRAEVPPNLIYRMLSNLFILRDARVLALIRSRPLPTELLDWPTVVPPPGLLLLLVDKQPTVRQWATHQISKYKVVPIPNDQFIRSFTMVVKIVSAALTRDNDTLSSSSPSFMPNGHDATIQPFQFPSDPAEFWAGFYAMLPFIPSKFLTLNPLINLDIRRIIIGRLHDTRPRQLSHSVSLTCPLTTFLCNLWCRTHSGHIV